MIPVGVLSCLFLATGALQSPDPAERLGREVPRLQEAAEIPGVAVALLRGGRLDWTGSFGLRRADGPDPVRVNTVFEAASLSKPVFAAAVLQLAARGEFNLDEPLWDSLKYERLQGEEGARRLTARMVLTHTTGLPNWGGAELTLAFEPGSSWNYSGEGYVYLQRVIERRTGLELDAFVRREVFEPVGMTQSSFVWQPAYEQVAATGHDPLGEPQEKRRPDSANAAASLHTTARDYGLFLEALLADRPLAVGTLQRMLEPTVAVAGRSSPEAGRQLRWGAGWGVQRGEPKTAFHWGDNGVFRCFVQFDPQGGSGLVYLTNSQNGLAVAAPLVATVFEGPQPALEWLGYEPWDDPRRTTRVQMQRAFLENAGEAGTLLGTARRERPGVVDQSFLINLAGFLRNRTLFDAAVAVMRLAVAEFPDSAAAHDQLAEAYLHAARWRDAIEASRRSLELDPENEGARLRIEWAEAASDRSPPPAVESDRLAELAGRYESREVRLREGRLFYERAGVGREYELYPLGGDLFGLQGLATFRLQFVSDETGRVNKVVGVYYDGLSDESLRDTP